MEFLKKKLDNLTSYLKKKKKDFNVLNNKLITKYKIIIKKKNI